MTKRKWLLPSFLGLAGALLVGSAAWACTYLPTMSAMIPQEAPKGTAVTMQGQAPGVQGAMEIRWNGVRGPKVGDALLDGQAFSASISVPDVAPGVYTLVGVSEDRAVVRAPFQVTGDGSAVSSPDAARLTAAPASSGPSSVPGSSAGGLPAGAALLSIGLVALFTSAVVVSVRRRSAAVRSPLS